MSTVRTYRTEAVALRAQPFAEHDKLLVLYTRDLGKVRVLAKGVRRTTSKLAAHVDLFSHAQLFLVHGRTFDLATQGQTLASFPLLRTHLWRQGCAFYCGELIERFTEEGSANGALFDALVTVLRRLNDAALDPSLCVRAFEIDLLALSGYRPQLHRCVVCATPVEPVENYFSAAEGGVICPRCAVRLPSAEPISMEALRILRNLQTRPAEIVGHVHVSAATLAQAEQRLLGYIQHLLDRRVRSVGFLEVLRGLQPVPEDGIAHG
jgi:DNA repair protein RecO (recombination protein O)